MKVLRNICSIQNKEGMYDFIYSFFVRLFERLKTVDPKDNATSMLLVVFFFHAFLLITLINYFTGLNLLTAAFGENHSKYLWLPIIILVMVIVYRVYKRRSSIALSKHAEKNNIISWPNSLFILVITIGPLLLGIYFLNSES